MGRACFRDGESAASEGAEVARTRATLSFLNKAKRLYFCINRNTVLHKTIFTEISLFAPDGDNCRKPTFSRCTLVPQVSLPMPASYTSGSSPAENVLPVLR